MSRCRSLSNLQIEDSSKLEVKCSSTDSLNRVKSASQEHIDKLSQPKSFKSPEKHMTLAEAVNKFQAGTPKTFRTTPKIKKGSLHKHLTEPKSPKLITARRVKARPRTAISTEDLEFEEAKKFKIKANPVPKSLHVPFKIQKRPPEVTVTHTPKVLKRSTKPPPPKVKLKKNNENTKTFKVAHTQSLPFSFEKRDLELKKKKEELIAKTIEEEKKAREFHANPLPKSILKTRSGSLEQINPKSNSSKVSYCVIFVVIFIYVLIIWKPAINAFKARPADVLKMKPFETQKERCVTQFEEFRFNTYEKVDTWQKYEQTRKEKKENIAEHKNRQQEEQEKARIRKPAQHIGNQLKNTNQCNKVTKPVSFHFHTDRIRNQEHMI